MWTPSPTIGACAPIRRPTRTDTPPASCARTRTGRRPVSAAYLIPHLRPGPASSTSAAGPARSPPTWPRGSPPARSSGSSPPRGPLAEARAHAAGVGAENTTFVVGDVYALDFPDGAFDVVHAHQVLQHLGDPVAALREMLAGVRARGIVARATATTRP